MKGALHPTDLVVAIRLIEGTVTFQKLSDDLGVSLSQAHASVARLAKAQLLRPGTRAVNRLHLDEFLIHGARYAFPAQLGPETRGIPTAHAAPALATHVDATDPYVWPSPAGELLGHAIEPLYPGAIRLRERAPETYRLLTLFDALRVGQARERSRARDLLREALGIRRAAA